MEKQFVRIHDISTNEVIDREMNETELAEFEKQQTETAERLAKEAETTAAKNALLERLGITEDEAKLLLS